MIGTTRGDGVVDVAMLEHAIREDLNENAPRAMCVLNPLKVVLTDYPEDKVEVISAPAHPAAKSWASATLPFTREIYIDRDDFREEANKKYKRLVLGKRVRLRNAYVIEADEVVKDAQGNIGRPCPHNPRYAGQESRGWHQAQGRYPLGLGAARETGDGAPVRSLFNHESPDKAEGELLEHMNPESLRVISGPGLNRRWRCRG